MCSRSKGSNNLFPLSPSPPPSTNATCGTQPDVEASNSLWHSQALVSVPGINLMVVFFNQLLPEEGLGDRSDRNQTPQGLPGAREEGLSLQLLQPRDKEGCGSQRDRGRGRRARLSLGLPGQPVSCLLEPSLAFSVGLLASSEPCEPGALTMTPGHCSTGWIILRKD